MKTNLNTTQTTPNTTQGKKELPYTTHFVATDQWVRDSLRKGLKKSSREFYFVKSVCLIADNRYFIELEKEFKLTE